jgi:hypothetical protein
VLSSPPSLANAEMALLAAKTIRAVGASSRAAGGFRGTNRV